MAGWKKLLKKGDEIVIPKVVSDNLRNSHDTETNHSINDASFHKLKTITFTDGIEVKTGKKIRVKFDVKSSGGGAYVYGKVYKNGDVLGTEQGTSSTTYVTKSEDLNISTIAAGETLELWGKAQAAGATVYIQNFRCYYDNDASVVSANS